jgi:hypothetical protein
MDTKNNRMFIGDTNGSVHIYNIEVMFINLKIKDTFEIFTCDKTSRVWILYKLFD